MAIMPTTREYSPPFEAAAQTGIEFDLLDLLLVMAQRKSTIILATMIGLFLGTGLVLLMHPVFTSKASHPASAAGAVERRAWLSQLSSLASLTGLGERYAVKDPNDLYLGVLQSNTVADATDQAPRSHGRLSRAEAEHSSSCARR